MKIWMTAAIFMTQVIWAKPQISKELFLETGIYQELENFARDVNERFQKTQESSSYDKDQLKKMAVVFSQLYDAKKIQNRLDLTYTSEVAKRFKELQDFYRQPQIKSMVALKVTALLPQSRSLLRKFSQDVAFTKMTQKRIEILDRIALVTGDHARYLSMARENSKAFLILMKELSQPKLDVRSVLKFQLKIFSDQEADRIKWIHAYAYRNIKDEALLLYKATLEKKNLAKQFWKQTQQGLDRILAELTSRVEAEFRPMSKEKVKLKSRSSQIKP